MANFSAFHFHRLFRAWTGETLGDYLRRRRVETGALRLVTQPRSTVLEVALAVGFGSGEAFARAFRQRFGASPSAWRDERNSGQADRSLDQAQGGIDFDHGFPATPLIEDTTMNRNVSLIDMPATPIAYFRHVGPYGQPVARFWMERVAPWMEREQALRPRALRHRPRRPDDHRAGEMPLRRLRRRRRRRRCCRASRCAPTLPGGRYACTRFEGTVDEVDAAWQRLLGGWLPTSGLQLDARPMLEHYPVDATFDPETGVFDCQLCIPVQPL